MLAALTGGIGSGKSTVLDIFKDLGAQTEDTDNVVHRIYDEDREVHSLLKGRWGNKVFSGSAPDRKAIAKLVFNNKDELQWLNSVMHPRVKKRIAGLQSDGITFIAVPLLYEVNWQNAFNKVVSVWCSTAKQLSRLKKRGWSSEEIDARNSAQISQDEKLTRADYGIINDWSLKSLTRQCRNIYSKLSN